MHLCGWMYNKSINIIKEIILVNNSMDRNNVPNNIVLVQYFVRFN